MAKRDVPEISGGAMADIAFMLLIFFLVATTMDTDSGLTAKLPPWQPNVEQNDDKIKERNVFVVLINRDNRLLVEGEEIDIKVLREKAKEFIVNPLNKENLPEKKFIEVPILGQVEVTKGVISLQNDRHTAYGKFVEVRNELIAAYNELRDELATRKFGKKLDDLDDEKAEVIKDVYPQKISEAEPRNIGGH